MVRRTRTEDELAELEGVRKFLDLLEERFQTHYECEDGWYSCPLSEEGCLDTRRGKDCTCYVGDLKEFIAEWRKRCR